MNAKRALGRLTICSVVAALILCATANATTVTWKGLDWTIRGTANSAAVQVDGSIDISVLPGNSADPAPDNWALTALLPTTTQWVEFSFIDETGANGTTVPRAYVDTSHDGGSTLIQGGGYSGYASAYINRHFYKGDWLVNEWINLGTRTANTEHTFLVGRRPDGSIDLYYDGEFKANVTDVDPPYFRRAYLGVQADAAGTTNVIGTYTNFRYGDTYIPEPASFCLVALGSLALIRRRRLA